jgi:hypothetical protein
MDDRTEPMHDWMNLITAEYQEMPGLRLTKPQVCRLWTLERTVCDDLLDRLVAAHVLERTARDEYILAGSNVV